MTHKRRERGREENINFLCKLTDNSQKKDLRERHCATQSAVVVAIVLAESTGVVDGMADVRFVNVIGS